jgi:amino acid adenylation domain-containing protein
VIACESVAERLTYAELDRTTDALAALLLADAAPGDPVALFLPRGPQLSVAALACLKAARPFVPLGEDDPEERLAAMCELARPRTLLAAGDGALPAPLEGLPRIELPLDPAAPAWAVPQAYDPSAPAYVLFTSGSTGTPKGVQVDHQALLNRLLWAQSTFRLTADDTVLQKTPYTFDVALWELLWPLIAGARIFFLEPGAHRDPGAIVEAIEREGVTLCHFVPSMLREFLRWPTAGRCRSLRDVLCSGEPLTPDLVRALGSVLDARLHNLYGPTEAAIDVTHWEVPPPLAACERVPIGKPVANTTLFVVDEELRIVPEGESGELCIAGVQLASGYVGQPELTEAAFCSLGSGVRVYRTGDRVRLVAGELEYLGRLDDQVKIRGVRVEPRESEHALMRHPAVAEAAVVPRRRGEHLELAAFVVMDDGARGDGLAHELRGAVRRALPEAFVPRTVSFVDAIPRTASGKQDRKLLARLAETETEPAEQAGAPAEELAACWLEALELGQADPSAGFLDLGGHSLAAARIAGRVLAGRGCRIPLAWLVRDNVSLDELRRRLDEEGHAVAGAAEARPDRVPLAPGQRRLWLLGQIHGSLTPYNVVSVLALDAPVDPERLEAALATVVGRHEALRTQIVTEPGGEPEQEILAELELPFSVVETSDLDADAAALAGELQWRPLPAGRAPLFAVVCLRDRDAGWTALAFVGNHLICDAQSTDLFWRELFAAYEGRPLSAPSSYAAAVRRRLAQGASDLAFWTDALDGAQSVLRMPFQRRRPDAPSFRGTTSTRTIGADAARLLHARAREAGVAPTAVLLAAFGSVLGGWSGQEEVVVGVPSDGREDVAEAGIVGFYVNTLPVRLPGGGEPLAEAARVAYARLRAAVAHSGVPFDDIARAVNVPREPGRNPLFQAWFNDVSVYPVDYELDGHPVRQVRPDDPPSLFDVGLYVHPGADGGLELDLTASRDLFDERVVTQLADAVLAAVERFVGGSSAARTAPPLRSSPNEAATARSLAERFRRHAAESPQRTAIRFREEDVSYEELARRVDRLAGAMPEDGWLGLVAGRSPDVAAAVLAGWETGMPFVLLDARAPTAYLESALEAAGVAVTIWADESPCPDGTGWTPIGELRARGARAAHRERAPEEPSHALATSGTSSVTKLVYVPSRSFAASLLDHASAFSLDERDRFAVLAGAGHDPVFRDLLLPLALGAVTTIPDERTFANPGRLLDELVRERPTVLHVTPARAALLVAAAALCEATLDDVRLVVVGGDALPETLVPDLRALCPAASIVNAYGTTEIPQVASLYVCGDRAEAADRVYVPIGCGAGSRELVVLKGDELAGVGELGEIGVVDTLPPARLADRPLPTRDVGGRRVILTGDRGRVNLDGDVEWWGRTDRQLSVAGHRVEPDQIELRLLEDLAIADAVVGYARPESRSGLAGYVVPAPAFATARAELDARLASLLDRLRASLPPSSVPEALHVVPRLVADRNGKPDVEATAKLAPAAERPPAAESIDSLLLSCVGRYLPPGTVVAPEANFFEAGLDSMTLLRLHADLQGHGYTGVALTDLFRWPNVRALGAALAKSQEPVRRVEPVNGAAPSEQRRRLREALNGSRIEKEALPWADRI